MYCARPKRLEFNQVLLKVKIVRGHVVVEQPPVMKLSMISRRQRLVKVPFKKQTKKLFHCFPLYFNPKREHKKTKKQTLPF